MAMASNSLLWFPNINGVSHTTPSTSKNMLSFHQPSHPFISQARKRELSVLNMASSSFNIPAAIDMDYLEQEFSGRGVNFTSIGDSCVVKMVLDNGSVASLMLPSGLITSYKPFMWHGATMELLQTNVLASDHGGRDSGGGAVVVQGGVSVALALKGDGLSWSPTHWTLQDVRGSSENFIQVELISSDSEGLVKVKYTVTLRPDLLVSEVVVASNLESSPIQMMGTIMSHLTVSSPDATYAVGLEGSNYWNKPPVFTDFSIVPPTAPQSKFWARSDNILDKGESEEEEEEKENLLQLTEKMSRIYTSAPRMFDIMDRGRRNSVGMGSDGFEELYIFSPGSNYEMYGKYAYICVGRSATLKPITLDPQGVWTGLQYLHNPNL